MYAQSFEKSRAWRRAMRLAQQVYRLTRSFPAEEKSGLAATLRRTVTTIPARIADGFGHINPADAIKSFTTVQGTLRELQTHLLLSHRLRFVRYWNLRPLRRSCRQIDYLLDDEIGNCQYEQQQARPVRKTDVMYDEHSQFLEKVR